MKDEYVFSTAEPGKFFRDGQPDGQIENPVESLAQKYFHLLRRQIICLFTPVPALSERGVS
jgi:hypothetical protein